MQLILITNKSSFPRHIIKELVDMLNQDRSPLGNGRQPPNSPLDPATQRALTGFSLITHGFGGPAIVAAMSATTNYLNEMLKTVEKNLSSSSGSSAANSNVSASSSSASQNLGGLGIEHGVDKNSHCSGHNQVGSSADVSLKDEFSQRKL